MPDIDLADLAECLSSYESPKPTTLKKSDKLMLVRGKRNTNKLPSQTIGKDTTV
jgi:hypothetical protein